MRNRGAIWGLFGLAAAGMVLWAAVGSSRASEEGHHHLYDKGERALSVHQMMEGLMKPNFQRLKRGLRQAPSSSEAWHELQLNAALLNEMSYNLMRDGRKQDEVWAKAASKLLRNNSAKLVEALEHEDFEAAQESFRGIGKGCKTCHDKHKEED